LLDNAETSATQQQPTLRLPKGFAWCEAFSLSGKNGTLTTLFKVEVRRPTDCLDGLKVGSMFFIVLGHACMEAMNVAGYKNAEDIVKTPLSYNAASTNPWTYLLLSGQLCVDTFLFISGFLLSFVGCKRPVPVVLGTLLRYARLMPLFGFVMMTYICVVPYLAWGPFSPRLQSDVHDSCQGSAWWSEFLFISDWYPWFNLNGGCMGWSWYLSIDMTFAIVGMVLLNIWKLSRPAGWALTLLLAVACIVVTMQQSVHYDLDYDIVSPSFSTYAHYLYFRPYTRFPGFALGLVTPWALDAMDKRGLRRGSQPTSLVARVVVLSCSMLAVGILAFCIFMPLSNTDGPGPSPPARDCTTTKCWSTWGNAFWIGLSRPLWVLGWVILTLACYFDYLPFFNRIFAAQANMTDYYTYSALDALQRATWYFVLAYGTSLVTWCLVEKPFATMTGWLVPKKGGARTPSAKPQEAHQAPAATELSA